MLGTTLLMLILLTVVSTSGVAEALLDFVYWASWKIIPSVNRWPLRTRLTPWRNLTR